MATLAGQRIKDSYGDVLQVSNSNDGADVNIYISNITKTFVTFESSQEFTGAVHFHVILISTD
jgi:hypothetical protein